MKTINIADASDAELRKFAEEKYGLNFGPQGNGAKRATIMAKLVAVHNTDTIEVVDDDGVQAPSPSSAVDVAQQQRDWAEQIKVIQIPMGEGKIGAQPVFVGVEGRGVLIPRGKWCEVKQAFIQALREAVEEQYQQVKGEDGLTKISDTPTYVPRYMFQEWHGAGEAPGLLRWQHVSKRAA